MFQGYFKIVSRKIEVYFDGDFREFLKLFQGCFKEVSRVFQDSF